MTFAAKSNRDRRSSLAVAPTLLFIAILIAVPAVAQQDAGGLIVSVRDPNGAAVPGAAVIVTNVDTNQTAEGVTNETGDFTASPLRPGRYKASVKREGFTTALSQVVTVGAQQIPRLEMNLAVGNVSESVNVTGQATLLQTVDVSKEMTVSGTLKDELPVLDRNYHQLSKLMVGVTSGTPNNARDRFGGSVSASGIKTTQTRFSLDGVDNTSYNQNLQSGRTFAIAPSMDSIAEFTVQTNAYSAEFGGGGGAAVTVITKSGGNQLHGAVFEYRQGSDVNANSFFNNARVETEPLPFRSVWRRGWRSGISTEGLRWTQSLLLLCRLRTDAAPLAIQLHRADDRQPGAGSRGLLGRSADLRPDQRAAVLRK
jgi:hypothetical protein